MVLIYPLHPSHSCTFPLLLVNLLKHFPKIHPGKQEKIKCLLQINEYEIFFLHTVATAQLLEMWFAMIEEFEGSK